MGVATNDVLRKAIDVYFVMGAAKNDVLRRAIDIYFVMGVVIVHLTRP